MSRKFVITVQCVIEGEAKDVTAMRKILKERPLEILNISGCHYKHGVIVLGI